MGRRDGFLIGIAVLHGRVRQPVRRRRRRHARRVPDRAGARRRAARADLALGLVLRGVSARARRAVRSGWRRAASRGTRAGRRAGCRPGEPGAAFIVNVPIGIAAIVAGLRVLPRTAAEGGPLSRPPGALLLAAGIGAHAPGPVEASSWGWTSWRPSWSLAAAAAASGSSCGAFARIGARSSS